MNQELLSTYRKHLNPNYAAFLEQFGLATTIREAKGAVLWDDQGCSYVDFVAGYGIFNLGHNPPRLVEALRAELGSYPLWNRPFLSAPLAEIAEKLVSLTPTGLDRVFVCSTGTEAVESAIKLARLSTGRAQIIAAKGAFHGFTLGALSVSGIPAQSRLFRPLLPGVEHVPYGDVDALATAVSKRTAAVLLEPIQAETGAVTPPEGYLAAAREICDRSRALLLVDEVRTGMGRTGPLFAIERERITPDVLILGKALAGGIVPIGAIVADGRIWNRFGLSFAMSASSFAGNRLACVAAVEALAILETEDVMQRGQRAGTALRTGLEKLAADHPSLVKGLTGKGLLLGLYFSEPRKVREVIRRCIEGGLLIAGAFCSNRCLLIEPPLTIELEQVAQGLRILTEACHRVAAQKD